MPYGCKFLCGSSFSSFFEKINKKLNILIQKESALLDMVVKTNFLEEALQVKTKDTNEKIERIENTLQQIQNSFKVINGDEIYYE